MNVPVESVMFKWLIIKFYQRCVHIFSSYDIFSCVQQLAIVPEGRCTASD